MKPSNLLILHNVLCSDYGYDFLMCPKIQEGKGTAMRKFAAHKMIHKDKKKSRCKG